MGYLLPQAQLKAFLAAAMRGADLVAPLCRADGVVVFEDVASEKDLARLDLSKNPPFTAKRTLMPAYEELFAYDTETQRLTDRKLARKRRVVFGMRLCDLNAVMIQDRLFMGAQFTDDHYKTARESLVLIGWHCNSPPSASCFCESMNLEKYYDLMLREKGDGSIYIDVGTEKGRELVEKMVGESKKSKNSALKITDHTEEIPKITTSKHLNTKDVRPLVDHAKWKEVTESQCLSCERCTLMCPTCMCFSIYDETKTDLQEGVRKRTWDSCHSLDFTRVAGDHVFRPDRTARFRHRVFHKLAYYPEVFGTSMCTGCGRCIEHCPAGIDFVEMINEMHGGRK